MPETAPPTDRANIPLLTLITQQSLDEDYRVVAERRAAENGGTPPPRRRPHRTAGLVVAAFGLLVTIAAVQTSQNEGVADASRTSLIQQIEASRDDVAHLQRRVVRLREHNLSLQSDLDDLTAEQQAAAARRERVEAATGFGPVHGPGVRISVNDSPSGERVTARDLRPLINGLWTAGAEAIAINGQRLTSRSAVKNSGDAIQIHYPLSPPYVVQAIGDPRTLQANLMETSSGLLFRDIATNLGYPWTMDNVEDDMSLPAAPARLLRLRNAVDPNSEQIPSPQKETPQ